MIILEWWKDGEWVPRHQWNYKDSILQPGPSLKDFEELMKVVYSKESSFSRKIIVCRLTRDRKETLAGNVFKQTGPPRFPKGASPDVRRTKIEQFEKVQELLLEKFGIPLVETKRLDLQTSLDQDPSIWAHW